MNKKNSFNDTPLIMFVVVVLFLCVFGYVVWSKYHGPIVYFSAKFYWDIINFIDFDIPIYSDWLKKVKLELMQIATYSNYAPIDVYFNVMNKLGKIFVGIPVLITIFLIYKMVKHPVSKFKRDVTIETLPWIMSKFAPSIIPSLYYGDPKTLLLNDDPIEHRSGLTPDEFVSENMLLNDGFFDRKNCKKILIKQLGKRLNNINELSDIEKTMFTIFSFRCFEGYDLNNSIKLCDDLNISCHKGTFGGKKGYPNISIINNDYDKFISKHDTEITNLIKKYKYSRVLLYAMHINALKKGKLPSSYFRWLKGMDRTLFYTLNTTGRKTPWTESAGVFNFHLWCEFNEPLGVDTNENMVEEAIDGIENYLIKIGKLEKL